MIYRFVAFTWLGAFRATLRIELLSTKVLCNSNKSPVRTLSNLAKEVHVTRFLSGPALTSSFLAMQRRLSWLAGGSLTAYQPYDQTSHNTVNWTETEKE